MNHKHTRGVLAVVLALVMFAGMVCLPQPAAAAEPGPNSLTLTYAPDEKPMADVTFRLFRVADVSRETVTFRPVAPYDAYHVLDGDGDWLTKASTLSGYVSRDGLEADATAVTDAAGTMTVSGLADGLYLILGETRSRDGYLYSPAPFLLSLPNTPDGHSWDSVVATHVKFTRTVPGDPTVQRRVIKVWNDEGSEAERPDSVTVDLLADGAVYDTVTLNAGNNWRHHWTGLDAKVQWQVVERETPGYTVTAEETGITCVLTNTPQDDIDDPDIPLDDKPTEDDGTDIGDEDVPLDRLPQTGQLWWPVPIMTVAGLLLVILGVARRRRGAWDGE